MDATAGTVQGGSGEMKVLVACEESQRVCIAFREKGHEAYSCDIEPCSGGHPKWHIQDNVLEHLDRWDMIIAFPPCTKNSNAGTWFMRGGKDRQKNRAKTFPGVAKAMADQCGRKC